MNKITMASLTFLLLLISSVAQAKDRYIVIYKSKQGFDAMDTVMKLESSKNWGMKKSLKHVHGMIFENSDHLSINKLKNHPEVAVVEKEIFFYLPEMNHFLELKDSDQKNLDVLRESGNPLQFHAGEKTSWGIEAIKAPEAWKVSGDAGSQVRIAVLDGGLDISHPAIAGNFEKGQNFTSSDAADIRDSSGHGTHISGTVAGLYMEDSGFVGVAPQAQILMAKVCSSGCSSIAITEGINWSIQEKVDVLNLSVGGPLSTASEAETLALQSAEENGIFVVAASGNQAVVDKEGTIKTPGVCYPAVLPSVFAVGAVGSQFVKSNFSNWGPELDIMAPGEKILSTAIVDPNLKGDDYLLKSGTSMATPHVAGVAALVLSAYKISHGGQTMKPADVRALLQRTARALSPNIFNEYGAGLIQADTAVAAAIAAP